ncbi:YraN family protein [Peptococcaceae bacterium 1198_IL3148]
MTFFRQKTGKLGEDAAVTYLKRRGMTIKTRNYRCRIGELDIVAIDQGVLVFVEVRSRRTIGYGLPQETIDVNKIAKVRRVAEYYLMVNKLIDVECRFDVIALQLNDEGGVKNLDYIRNAF